MWVKSKRARFHTDLLVIDGLSEPSELSVRKYSFAPVTSRPWGIDLPSVSSFCRCGENDPTHCWKYLYRNRKATYGERFFCFRSSCGHSDVALAVFVEGTQEMEIDGTHVVLQDYNESLTCFPLDGGGRVKINAAVVGIF